MDGLGVIHLQSAISTSDEVDRLLAVRAESWAAFETPDALPECWRMFSMARLSAVGPERRPIAVGSTMRTGLGWAWCMEYRPWLGEVFRGVGQFGVTIRSRSDYGHGCTARLGIS